MVINRLNDASRRGERGAVSVKAVLIVAFIVIAAMLLIKIVPVYVEQQQTAHDTDELARKASLGMTAYSKDKIEKEITNLIRAYRLPEGSILLASMDRNHSEISVKYTRNVGLLITSYAWSVDYKSVDKGIYWERQQARPAPLECPDVELFLQAPALTPDIGEFIIPRAGTRSLRFAL